MGLVVVRCIVSSQEWLMVVRGGCKRVDADCRGNFSHLDMNFSQECPGWLMAA